ncbi:diguanylate cyclase domain-containing protein [Psychromonas sp.]|uniref:diguanylate cyclase domain-containing protein n=1 Tax=Psychromonas sp. TaxID=1884585 RepID=UPI0039E2EC32
MSNSIRNVLHLGDNAPLVDALLSSIAGAEKADNYHVFHLVNVEPLYLTLSENSFSHLISEFPLNADLKDKIKADFPLLNTTYLNTEVALKRSALSIDVENVFTDEVQVVLESLSIPVYFKNKQAQYLACNRHFSKLFGLTPDQVTGKKYTDISDSFSSFDIDIDKIDRQMCIDHQAALLECRGGNISGEQRDFLLHKECAANGEMQIGLIFDITELNNSKYLLEKERLMLRTTANIFQDMIFIKDLESRVLGCNNAFEKFVGYSEKEILGKNAYAFFVFKQAMESIEEDQRIIKTSQVNIKEVFTTDCNGELQFLEVKKVPLRDKQGNVQGVIAVGRNMSEQLKMQKRLKISDTAFENGKENMFVTDNTGNIIAANRACCETTGYSKDELLQSHVSIFATNQLENIATALLSTKSWQGDLTYHVKNGEIHFAWAEIYIVEHQELEAVSRICAWTDLRQSENVEPKIKFLSKQDPLTGLRNRINLFSRLEDIITSANYQRSAVAVILVDVDDFKGINDTHGHNAGDQVLKEVAERLRSCVSEKETLGRFANDQFIIIIDELANEHDAATVAHKIADQFSSAFIIENLHTNLTVKIGISLSPDDGIEVGTLFLNAEKAMKRGKSDKSTAYHFYTIGLNLGLKKEFELEKELKQALLSKQFDLYYQPQYDINKRQIVALEALLRWHHPKRGMLLPERFLSVAEKRNLLVPIGWEMIRKAALQAVSWTKSEIKFGRIAINLFPVHLSQISFIAELQTILKETGCSAGQLELLVDKVILRDASIDILSNLKNVNKMGITLTVTNFGIASNVIDLINHLGIENLKIPEPLIKNGLVSLESDAQLKSVNILVSSLGLSVLSDALEDAEQQDLSSFQSVDSKTVNLAQKKAMSASKAAFFLRCNKHK